MQKKEFTSVREPVKPTTLRFSDLVDKLKEKGKSLARNPNYIRDTLKQFYAVLEKLEKLRRKQVVNVRLKIPAELAKKLGDGKVMRVNGIVKQKENYAAVTLLKEAKPSNVKKLLKTKNIAFKAVDLLESVLLDRKLEEIVKKVEEIDRKLDAQNKGALKSAFQQMRELPLIQNPEIKKSKILLIQDKLSHCEHVFGEIYDGRWHEYKRLKAKFENAAITNKKELIEMCELGEKLPADLEPVILCKVARVKLYEMQEEFVLAQEKAFDLAGYVGEKLEDFKREFSGRSMDGKNENYKNPADFNKKKTLARLKDQLLEANETIEYLLNITLSFALTVPEEISQQPVKRPGFLRRIILWFKKVFKKNA